MGIKPVNSASTVANLSVTNIELMNAYCVEHPVRNLIRAIAFSVLFVAPSLASAHTWVIPDGRTHKCEYSSSLKRLHPTNLPSERLFSTPMTAYRLEEAYGFNPTIKVIKRFRGQPFVVGVTANTGDAPPSTLYYFRNFGGIGMRFCQSVMKQLSDTSGLH